MINFLLQYIGINTRSQESLDLNPRLIQPKFYNFWSDWVQMLILFLLGQQYIFQPDLYNPNSTIFEVIKSKCWPYFYWSNNTFSKSLYHNPYIHLNINTKLVTLLFLLLPPFFYPLFIESTLDRGNVVHVFLPIVLWTLGWGLE